MLNTVLMIGAHPDDIEAGTGGLAAALAARDWRVVMYVATNGKCGGDPASRVREQEEAARLLGADVWWGKLVDDEISIGRATIADLERVIAAVRPAVLLTHWLRDTHQDHRRLTAATLSAARRIPNILFYEGPSSHSFLPTTYFCIDDHMDIKMKALGSHRSQLCRTRIADFASATALRRGAEARLGHYAEGFIPFRSALFIGDNGRGQRS